MLEIETGDEIRINSDVTSIVWELEALDSRAFSLQADGLL
jgi:hypothetical protein